MLGPAQLIVILLFIGLILLVIFFNLALQNALGAVREKNRGINPPGLIWLNLIPIPFLNTVWTAVFGIVTCNAINKDAGKKIAPVGLAIAYPVASLIGSYLMYGFYEKAASYERYRHFAARPEPQDLFLPGLITLAGMILWIIFWVNLNSAKRTLQGMNLTNNMEGDSELLDSGFTNNQSASPKQNEQSDSERIEAIKKYKALLDEGVITEEEFKKKKQDLL